MSATLSQGALTQKFERLRERCLALISTLTPRAFAEEIMRLPDDHGATRPFSFAYAPYQLQPYEELFNPRNQEVALMWASRMGKSRVVCSGLGFIILIEPCRIAVMWPTEGDGKLWSKDDFMGELIEPTPELAALIEDATGLRKAGNTHLRKKFLGGLLQILGANAAGRVRRVKARFLYAEEIDAILGSLTDEGDMLKIFGKRGDEFPDTIKVYCSYPSLKGHSRIEALLEGSDYRQWFVTCLLCGGEPYVMHRTQLRYDREHPEGSMLECPRCHGHLTDLQRYRMMMGGDPKKPRYDLWRPTRPFRGKAGFQANSLLWPHPIDPAKYPGGFLQMLAQRELDAEKSDNPQKSWRVIKNTEDAETHESESHKKPVHSVLFLRREPYDPEKMLPPGVLWVCFGADVQADRVEMEIVGVGQKRQTWGLGYHVLRGTPLVPPDTGVWAELDRLVTTSTFPHPSGHTLRVSAGLADRGYKPDHVLEFTRPRASRGIYASRGATSLCRPIVQRRPKKEGKPEAKVWELGTHEAKDIIYQHLERDNPAADGYAHFPIHGSYSEQYFTGLLLENSTDQKASDGKYYRFFECPEGGRNEPLDIRVMIEAIIRIKKPNFAKLAEKYAVRKEGEEPPDSHSAGAKSPTPPKPTAPAARRSFVQASGKGVRRGFVGGWRK